MDRSDERAVPVGAAPTGRSHRDEVGDDLDLDAPDAGRRDLRPDADLDLDATAEPAAGPAAARGPGFGRWAVLAIVGLVVVAGSAVSVLLPSGPEAPRPVVVGAALPVPVAVRLPDGVRPEVDGMYVSLRVDGRPSTEANLLITAPTRVMEASGALAELPADPADWLRGQRAVRVTRVNHVLVGGRRSVQIDYRLAAAAGGRTGRFGTVALFCGVGPAESRLYPWAALSCSRISRNVRVRATFVPIDNRILVVDAYWSPATIGPERIPAHLEQSYDRVLAGLTFVVRSPRNGSAQGADRSAEPSAGP